ncbi:hypothetical protein A2230_03940 [candidate division WOR-1 bacterium RIFOXYA2_FULL_36_21]|uniref:Suppressor of fused-like domain-containing protein n=1 Tax=candidate division WOR-1 bacterium RIFOXYB2_FULL_36_35 TaxID=1802578 RepID=A0A1F4S146_UNCSA|nr:MAG: hypothetical protein A2230_03940 [candidate division WOR-1 bacterium RIFOXYA2_FULL_36_21]OGC14117.1 MAG: hypothetical protein A2290_06410 [candidate division WOR-1 bacterium RIFOXYB2_FULL_36_35]OGC16507.1 MAG: hypothetical protein A2282_02100 [candidate division WOR-1 bacterium RIFOXYA12_FULL_36_13]
MPVSEEKKIIAKTMATAFGGTPVVHHYWNDSHSMFVDILECFNRPYEGAVSCGTIGLSDFCVFKDSDGTDVGVEIVGGSLQKAGEYGNVLASAAFALINGKKVPYPGFILKNIVNANSDFCPKLPHLYFSVPFIWNDGLNIKKIQNKKIGWLLAFPISEEELNFVVENGDRKFEALMTKQKIDIYDLSREPINK